jgi:hypothetical protein
MPGGSAGSFTPGFTSGRKRAMAFQTRGGEFYLTQREEVMPITEVQERHYLIIGTGENMNATWNGSKASQPVSTERGVNAAPHDL